MGQAAQVSCTATIFYMHTLAYVALISTQICPIFILMKVYCMCAYNIWCHKNGLCRWTSPRPSHVLAHHPNCRLPLVLRAMHEMENGCLSRLLSNVSGLHTKMHVRAQWQLLLLHCSCNGIHVLMHQYPMMRPQTHHNLPTPTHLHHKFLPHPHHQRQPHPQPQGPNRNPPTQVHLYHKLPPPLHLNPQPHPQPQRPKRQASNNQHWTRSPQGSRMRMS